MRFCFHLLFLSILLNGIQAFAEFERGTPPQLPRFQSHINKLNEIFNSSTDLDTVLDALCKGGRGPAFALEGLLKMYEDKYSDTVGTYHERVKLLEDQLGWYIDSRDHIKFAEKLKWNTPDGKMPKAVREHLEQEVAEHKANFVKSLEKSRWIKLKDKNTLVPGSPLLKTFESQLSPKMTEWEGKNLDRLTILDSLNQHIKKHLQKADYDLNDLQGGVHKLRRELRWVTINLQALGGLVALDDTPTGFRKILKDKKTVNNKYANVPEFDAKYALFFPRETFLMLTKLVEEMGNAKDMGEAMHEWLPRALLGSGYAKSETEAFAMAKTMVEEHEDYVDTKEVARRVYRTVKETQLFEKTRDYLKEQLSWSKKDCRKAMEAAGLI